MRMRIIRNRIAMVLLALWWIIVPGGAIADELPEAPRPRVFDWTFITVHAAYGASSVFDNWETQKNLGTCAWEGNPDLGRNPSPRSQAVHAAVEFTAVVAGDALMKWSAQRQGLPQWLSRGVGSVAAAVGLGKHLQGGMEWVRLCH